MEAEKVIEKERAGDKEGETVTEGENERLPEEDWRNEKLPEGVGVIVPRCVTL